MILFLSILLGLVCGFFSGTRLKGKSALAKVSIGAGLPLLLAILISLYWTVPELSRGPKVVPGFTAEQLARLNNKSTGELAIKGFKRSLAEFGWGYAALALGFAAGARRRPGSMQKQPA